MINLIKDKTTWDHTLKDIGNYDFYHSYDYHHILKKENEIPILIVYKSDKTSIAIPFLERKINDTYYDLTSVHGYLGPISEGITQDFDSTGFQQAFKELLENKKVVSVFSKLNPFIANQNEILNNLGSIQNIGELVFYDQHADDEIQLKGYNRNTRQKLKQLKKSCHVNIVEDDRGIEKFIELYHDSLVRLCAKKIFYFDKAYFKTLLNLKSSNAKMIVAIHNETNEIAGGVFCIATRDIAHIEVAFTNKDYYKESPVRILFDESRKLFKLNNEKYLNIGGGSGGREGSLMRFKSSFTQNYKDFNIWKYIVLPEVYEALLTKEQKKTEQEFFPKYRLTLKE